jgi:hypothetical protein
MSLWHLDEFFQLAGALPKPGYQKIGVRTIDKNASSNSAF